MKVGSVGTHLHLVCAEPERLPETAIATNIGTIMMWEGFASSPTQQEVAEHGVHSFQWWSDNRTARIAMLRARVKSGTYKVDSTTIAESILSDKIHSE
ncbi:MAG: flagellar biosynthesis anti-sigma factor FlgM [Ktedonobacteraceae bacterium]|nr:flagellar biosynthesis anti-sigma factor FlgM [Ktedonobacteraceae bacterium]MBV9614274.1 flagellar biosynthesis anti-sigma factor FlgM [Ktedonobacteraceae bacterium]MBV9713492.1 flagellar biosynthesis anti-sigma factor FlgM [Ktedonobacteraceae bacterium]